MRQRHLNFGPDVALAFFRLLIGLCICQFFMDVRKTATKEFYAEKTGETWIRQGRTKVFTPEISRFYKMKTREFLFRPMHLIRVLRFYPR